MGRIVTIKGVDIGKGLPKICVPMVGRTIEELIEEVNSLKNVDFDIVEWRVDFLKEVGNIDKVKESLKSIRKIIGNKPMIFTFRSAREGGEAEAKREFYVKLNKTILETELVDIIDVELFNHENDIRELVDAAHKKGAAVIISNHDFKGTPEREEIISRLRKARELGGDIPKIAVMPNSVEDVLTLLDATRIMKEKYADCPIITMSMAGKGVVSRLAGELFGSDLTFGAVKKASAPGQISVTDLRKIIELLHDNL